MARSYSLPDFNLVCYVWFEYLAADFSTWVFTAPDLDDADTIDGQLYSDAHDAGQSGQAQTSGFGTPALIVNSIELRVPKATPPAITTPHVVASRRLSLVYCGPDADGMFRFYWTAGEVVRHKGFPNEHKAWCLGQFMTLDADPYP